MTEDVLALWGALGMLIGTLLLIALTLWAGTRTAVQVRALWGALRGSAPQVLAAVDEPGDALNVALARLTPLPASVWAALLAGVVRALVQGLDGARADVEQTQAACEDRAGEA